jgi:hypothetical protein
VNRARFFSVEIQAILSQRRFPNWRGQFSGAFYPDNKPETRKPGQERDKTFWGARRKEI